VRYLMPLAEVMVRAQPMHTRTNTSVHKAAISFSSLGHNVPPVISGFLLLRAPVDSVSE
jgi:hypothetical protein